MRDKKTLDENALAEIKSWLVENTEKGTLSDMDFRTLFGEVYDFESTSNRTRRDIIDLCDTGRALYVVLLWVLRPSHFGDIQSGDSYLDHIQSLEELREVTPLEQFWIHRVALIYVLSKTKSMNYAHRSLYEVIDFSTTTDATLDALVGMTLGTTYENLGIAALDKWYKNADTYLAVRTIYHESAQIRKAMRDLEAEGPSKTNILQLPPDLL